MATTSWLGQVIRDLRHERGWTQNDLAGYAGVHPLTILRIEHNHQVGSMRVISLIAPRGVSGTTLPTRLPALTWTLVSRQRPGISCKTIVSSAAC